MVGRANNGGSVFSWADEVEKEEEEAAAAASSEAQPQQRQKKPNPFGSARPREVVLQDKGIDWRQLDLHPQQSSPLLNGSHENEKLQKQSNPQLVTVSSHPHVTSSPRIQSVPPLRYPPKYVAGILYEHWVSRHLKIEKADRSKNESTMRRRTRNEFVEAKGEIMEGKENFHGLPLVNQNIGTPEMHGKRMSLPTNIHVDSGAKGYQKAPRFVHKASKQWCSSKEEF